VSEKDFMLAWNLTPNTEDEAKKLIPGLNSLEDANLKKLINFINEKRGHAKINY